MGTSIVKNFFLIILICFISTLLVSCGNDDLAEVEGSKVTLTLEFKAPTATGASLSAKGSKGQVLADASIDCSFVVNDLGGSAAAEGTAVNGVATISVDPALLTNGVMVVCPTPGGSEALTGAICATEAVTADLNCTIDSTSASAWSSYTAECASANGGECVDSTGKATRSLLIPLVNTACFWNSLYKMMEDGDSTSSLDGTKCAGLFSSVMQQVIAAGENPVNFTSNLYSEDPATVARAAALAGISVADMTTAVETCKDSKDLIKSGATDSGCSTSSTTLVTAAEQGSKGDIESWLSAPPSLLNSTFGSWDSTSMTAALAKTLGAAFAQGKSESFASFSKSGFAEALKKITDAAQSSGGASGQEDLFGRAFINMMMAGLDPASFKNHPDTWLQFLIKNLSLAGASSLSSSFSSILQNANSLIDAVGAAGGSIDSTTDLQYCGTHADCTAPALCCNGVCQGKNLWSVTSTGSCSFGSADSGGSCSKDSDCRPGNICANNLCAIHCAADSECTTKLGSGATCVAVGSNGKFCKPPQTPTPTLKGNGETCSPILGCDTGLICTGAPGSGTTCKASGVAGDICSSSLTCGTGLNCNSSNLCAAGNSVTTLLDTISMFGNMPCSFVADANGIAFFEYMNPTASNTLGQMTTLPLAGGSKTIIANGIDQPRCLSVIGSNLFYSTTDSVNRISAANIFSCSRTGNNSCNTIASSSTSFTFQDGVWNDGTNIFFGNASQSPLGKIQKVSVGAMNVSSYTDHLTATDLEFPMVKLVQGTHIYYVTGAEPANAAPYTISKVGTGAGATATDLATNLTLSPVAFCSDGTTLCWTATVSKPGSTTEGTLSCVAVAGGSVTTVATGLWLPTDCGVSGGQVYVADGGPFGSTPGGGITKYPVTGGTGTVIASGVRARKMEIVGDTIYFADTTGNFAQTDLSKTPQNLTWAVKKVAK